MVDLRNPVRSEIGKDPPSAINVIEDYVDEDGKVRERVVQYMRYDRMVSRWEILRDGRYVVVDEEDLTDDEENMLRCDALLEPFRVAQLQDEIEGLQQELEERKERLSKVDADGQRFLTVLMDTVSSGKGISEDVRNLMENLYVATMPFSKLTPQQEADMRERLSADAKDDFEKGEFKTIKEALEHYGLSAEVEDE